MEDKYSQYERIPLQEDLVILLVKDGIKTYIMKRYRYEELYLNELRILELLKSNRVENVPQLVDNYHLVIICKYIEGSDLFDYIDTRPRNEDELKPITIQICKLVRKIHNLGIFHRDIKLENFIIDESKNIHMIDFGLSQLVTDKFTAPSIIPGSAQFISRDYVKLYVNTIIGKKVNRDKVNTILLSNDIFATSVALYLLYNLDYPYKSDLRFEPNSFDIIVRVLNNPKYQEVMKLSKKISDENIMNIVELCFDTNYKSRIILWNTLTVNLE